jgi:hypothetical protein
VVAHDQTLEIRNEGTQHAESFAASISTILLSNGFLRNSCKIVRNRCCCSLGAIATRSKIIDNTFELLP